MCAEPNNVNTGNTFNPTFTNNSNPACNPTFNTEINPQFITNTNSTINAIGTQMRDITLRIVEKAQETFSKKNCAHAQETIKNLLWHNRYTIATGTIAGIYSATAILLWSDYNYLTTTPCWSRWKSNSTLEDLYAIPHKELEQELLRSIGQRNYNKTDPTDFSHPLITFIATIETEIKICKRYLAIAKATKRFRLITILPTNKTKIKHVRTCLARCLFIKHIFLSWLAERNLTTKSIKRAFIHGRYTELALLPHNASFFKKGYV